MDVTDLLARAVAAGASDLHLAAGEPPLLRLDGELQRMALPVLTCTALEQGMAGLLDEGQRRQWLCGDELDLALSLPGAAEQKGLLQVEADRLAATPRGQLFLNDLLQYFLN